MTHHLKPLTLPFLAFILVTLVGAFVVTASPAAAQGGVPPVTNIELRSGPNPGEVIVSWNAVPQATHYRIGYVNMELDYHLAKASCTGEWIEAFVYIDVNARNIPVSNGRAEYTVRRLSLGARHAFTVLTSNNFYNNAQNAGGDFSWPSNPRWQFLPGRNTLPAGVTLPSGECSAPPTSSVTPNQPLTNAQLTQLVKPALGLVITSDGYGTGFVVSSDGLMVTNRHVVDGESTVDVHMIAADGHMVALTGQVLGRGILADLAVIRLPAGRTYPALSLANSDDVAQGDEITAWGHPSASFLGAEPTLTQGIISATSRIFDDTKYIQTDASIAGGSSGGPVVDRFGRVVGVNTAGLVDADGNPIPGIYLAIASNEVSSRLSTMVAGGPSQATYRNLRHGYGYRMDIPKGWYLSWESAVLSSFDPYTGRRIANISTLPIREPFYDRSTELTILADYIYDVFLPEYAAENWAFFRPISKTKITIAGNEFYRLEYHARWRTDLCILNVIEMVSISSQFPGKPHGFITSGSICEDSLTTHSGERQTMLNSFRP